MNLTTNSPIILITDLQEFDRIVGLERQVCEANKCEHNPILPLGEVHEHDSAQARSWCGSCFFDEHDRQFKMWYLTADHHPQSSGVYNMAYAVSDDGVNWTKPKLGMKNYRGSTDNNLIHLCEQDDLHIKGLIQGWQSDDPAKRYAAYAWNDKNTEDGKHAHYLYYSSDGLTWTRGERVEAFDWHRNGMLDVHSFFYDEQETDPARRYKCYGQTFTEIPTFSQKLAHVPGDTPDDHLPIDWLNRISVIHKRSKHTGHHRGRAVARAFSPDGVNWDKVVEPPCLDPNHGPETEIHFCNVLPYGGQYLMVYEHAYFEPLFDKYYGDLRLAHSRDGVNFTRLSHSQPIVRRGKHGSWDDGFLVTSDRTFIHDDKLWIYYAGCGEDWNHWPRGEAPDWAGATRGSIYKSQQGLATLPLDRFTALATLDGETPGTALTHPIEIKSPNATLWVNTSQHSNLRSWITAECLDADTLKPIEGYTQYDCDRILREALRHRVTWQGKANLENIKRIRLRFCIHGASKLHAFGWTDDA